MNLDNVAKELTGLFVKKSTAIAFEILLVLGGLYLIIFEESPYALLFQTPVVIVCLIVNYFWIMELIERESREK